MENETQTFHLPLPVRRDGHADVLLMAKAYGKLALDVIDYVFVNHEIPVIK